jgi:hypothetical protein
MMILTMKRFILVLPVIKIFFDKVFSVSGFLRVLRFPPAIKHCHDVTEILLKVMLNTITLTHIFFIL